MYHHLWRCVMPCKRLKDYLERNNIQYSVINHPLSFSAQTTAHLSHISGKDVVKTVIVKIKGDLKMMVLPANQMVNLRFLKICMVRKMLSSPGRVSLRGCFLTVKSVQCRLSGACTVLRSWSRRILQKMKKSHSTREITPSCLKSGTGITRIW